MMEPYIDIHSHIWSRLDDGEEDFEISLLMLCRRPLIISAKLFDDKKVISKFCRNFLDSTQGEKNRYGTNPDISRILKTVA